MKYKEVTKSNGTTHKLYHGDNVEVMKGFEDNSIALTVTSPPYDDMRSYDESLKWDFDIFKSVADELYRITEKGGIVVWVVGDKTVNGSETGTSFRQALYFKEIGFKLHDTMIYRKENYLPLNHNRYDPEFEYMFVFSKGKPNTFNALRQPCVTAGGKYNYATRSSASTKEKGGAIRARDEEKITNDTKYRGNIWGYAVGKHKGSKDDIWSHPATMPEKLAEDHILSWSNEGDLVFDPFMGSGTTAKMAFLKERHSVGIEKVEAYYNLAYERIENAVSNELPKDLFDV